MLPLPRLPAVAALDSALFIGTNWVDLTDGGATTLHKHDHGGQDGLTDDDHVGYFRGAGRAGGQIGIGGTGVGDALVLKGTSANGTLTVEAIKLMVGNDGNTYGLSILNSGECGIGCAPVSSVGLALGGTVTSVDHAFGLHVQYLTLTPANGYNAFFFSFGGNVDTGAANTVPLAAGVYSGQFAKIGTGTITDTYGLYITLSAAGTNNYGGFIEGKLGIGIDTPTEMLDVVGNGKITGTLDVHTAASLSGIRAINSYALSASASGGMFKALTSLTPTAADQRIGQLHFGGVYYGGNYAHSAQIIGYSSEAWDSTHAGAYIAFRTIPAGGSLSSAERMRIGKTVGIGWSNNDNVALTLGGTITSPNNSFGFYMASVTLEPANGWDAFCQYFGGNTVVAGTGFTIGKVCGGLVATMTKSGAGTITNSYGLYIDVSSLATNNYGMFCGGKVGINNTAPAEMLDVTGNAKFSGSVLSTGTAGIGYATGAGGTVTQLTNKSTGVTINKTCGAITTHNATLNAATSVTFTVTNSTVAATDVISLQHDSGGTVGSYTVTPNTSAAGSFKITLRNITAGNLGEALAIRFAVIKAVAA